MSNDELIAEIRARVNAATEGPWVAYGIYVETVPEFVPDPFDIMPEPVAKASWGDHDAKFIAHARQDIPNLAAALEKSEAEVVRLGGVIAEAIRVEDSMLDQSFYSIVGEMVRVLERGTSATVSAEEGAK